MRCYGESLANIPVMQVLYNSVEQFGIQSRRYTEMQRDIASVPFLRHFHNAVTKDTRKHGTAPTLCWWIELAERSVYPPSWDYRSHYRRTAIKVVSYYFYGNGGWQITDQYYLQRHPHPRLCGWHSLSVVGKFRETVLHIKNLKKAPPQKSYMALRLYTAVIRLQIQLWQSYVLIKPQKP